MGERDGWLTVALAVGEVNSVLVPCPKTNEVGGIADVAGEPGTG